jgi:asparagine synthase (glutamine-hydrolysing)
MQVACNSTLAETGWFDLAAVGGMISEHHSGRCDRGRALWQLVMLDRSLSQLFDSKS